MIFLMLLFRRNKAGHTGPEHPFWKPAEQDILLVHLAFQSQQRRPSTVSPSVFRDQQRRTHSLKRTAFRRTKLSTPCLSLMLVFDHTAPYGHRISCLEAARANVSAPWFFPWTVLEHTDPYSQTSFTFDAGRRQHSYRVLKVWKPQIHMTSQSICFRHRGGKHIIQNLRPF